MNQYSVIFFNSNDTDYLVMLQLTSMAKLYYSPFKSNKYYIIGNIVSQFVYIVFSKVAEIKSSDINNKTH